MRASATVYSCRSMHSMAFGGKSGEMLLGWRLHISEPGYSWHTIQILAQHAKRALWQQRVRVVSYGSISYTSMRIYRRIYVSLPILPCIYAEIQAYTAGVYSRPVASGKFEYITVVLDKQHLLAVSHGNISTKLATQCRQSVSSIQQ